jgi:hypothetical protein
MFTCPFVLYRAPQKSTSHLTYISIFSILHRIEHVSPLFCAFSSSGFLQCRVFEPAEWDTLGSCQTHLGNATLYHRQVWPYPTLTYMIDEMAKIFTQYMDPVCAANAVDIACNAMFRECGQVENAFAGENLWLPALMCRSECDKHAQIWEGCLREMERDVDLLTAFDDQTSTMMSNIYGGVLLGGTVLPDGSGCADTEGYKDGLGYECSSWGTSNCLDKAFYTVAYGYTDEDMDAVALNCPQSCKLCDVDWPAFRPLACDATAGIVDEIAPEKSVLSWFLGQFPARDVHFPDGPEFPAEISGVALYPEVASEYASKSGGVFDVPCYIPGANGAIRKITCPSPFLPRTQEDSGICVQPCPVAAYNDAEYSQMWTWRSIVSVLGLVLNVWMVLTWVLAGRKAFAETRLQLKMCVFCGILYGLVDTIPVLLLKYDLPCACETAECTGTSVLCVINRSSIYLLLAIMVNLTSLVCDLYTNMSTPTAKQKARQRVLAKCGVAFPFLLLFVAYFLDGQDQSDSANAVLNIARHAINCEMRFPSMAVEWCLLHFHFLWLVPCCKCSKDVMFSF